MMNAKSRPEHVAPATNEGRATPGGNTGNTLEGRIEADRDWPYGRFMLNPNENGCCAVLKLGKMWARLGLPVLCSRRALPDNAFCGLHDHLNVVCGISTNEEFLGRALTRAHLRGLPGLRVLRESA